jgi:hypothetical protein
VPKLELARPSGGDLEARLTYNKRAFTAAVINELAVEFTAVATAAPRHLGSRLSSLTGRARLVRTS